MSTAPKVKVLVRVGFDLTATGEHPRMPRHLDVEDLRQQEVAVIEDHVPNDADVVLLPYPAVELAKTVESGVPYSCNLFKEE